MNGSCPVGDAHHAARLIWYGRVSQIPLLRDPWAFVLNIPLLVNSDEVGFGIVSFSRRRDHWNDWFGGQTSWNRSTGEKKRRHVGCGRDGRGGRVWHGHVGDRSDTWRRCIDICRRHLGYGIQRCRYGGVRDGVCSEACTGSRIPGQDAIVSKGSRQKAATLPTFSVGVHGQQWSTEEPPTRIGVKSSVIAI